MGLSGSSNSPWTDGGVGGPFFMAGGGPYALASPLKEDEDGSILSKIRAARSTRAPGFFLEVVGDADEAEALSGEAAKVAETMVEREALAGMLTKAIEREDYATAALLKKELDQHGG